MFGSYMAIEFRICKTHVRMKEEPYSKPFQDIRLEFILISEQLQPDAKLSV